MRETSIARWAFNQKKSSSRFLQAIPNNRKASRRTEQDETRSNAKGRQACCLASLGYFVPMRSRPYATDCSIALSAESSGVSMAFASAMPPFSRRLRRTSPARTTNPA